MQLPNTARVAESSIMDQPPDVIYQTRIVDGKQDSSSLEKLSLSLSDAAAAAVDKHVRAGGSAGDLVHGAIRRFDLTELSAFDDKTHTMQGVRLPQQTFVFDFHASTSVLVISVHRKELPVSRSFGEAPFVFVFFVKPTEEVVVTSRFIIASKQPPQAKAPKPAPKRVRKPPPRRPTMGPAQDAEAVINALLVGPGAGSGAPTIAPVQLPGPSAAKRVRCNSPVAAVLGAPPAPSAPPAQAATADTSTVLKPVSLPLVVPSTTPPDAAVGCASPLWNLGVMSPDVGLLTPGVSTGVDVGPESTSLMPLMDSASFFAAFGETM